MYAVGRLIGMDGAADTIPVLKLNVPTAPFASITGGNPMTDIVTEESNFVPASACLAAV